MFGGAKYRLEIGAAIADVVEFKYFSAGDLSERTGISKQSVSHELQALESAGLIARVPAGDDSARKVYYNRHESRYWDWCREGAAAAKEMLDRKAPY